MKYLAILFGLFVALFPLTSCKTTEERPTAKRIAEVVDFFEKQQKAILTFAGYSGAEYEKPDHLKTIVTNILNERDPKTTIINIGVTPDGIGIVYHWAKEMGFQTTGVVSSKALEYESAISAHVDHPFFIEDNAWGGYIEPGNPKLTPTSEVMVKVSDEMIAIGGGNVTRDELQEMQKRGKTIQFFPAEMNRARAIEKAKKKHLPEPTSFDGAAHQLFTR